MQDIQSFAGDGVRHGGSNKIYASVVEISETKKSAERAAEKCAKSRSARVSAGESAISDERLYEILLSSFGAAAEKKPSKILIIPPDYTRMYSGAGKITNALWRIFKSVSPDVRIDIFPALGTHAPMTKKEFSAFFGDEIPFECMIIHRWRQDVVKIGEVPAEFVSQVSDGLVNEKTDVEINRIIIEGGYDLIISAGQVVPHEVVGMANYSKNIFVGCGGPSMIGSSHMLGAFYGMERIMGKDFSPVRRVFDYAENKFLREKYDLPLVYILTVTTSENEKTNIHGIYIGKTRAAFEKAVDESRRLNLIHLDRPIKKAVVYLCPEEFKSTWLGNKAIYRTRMAIADHGELIVIAPAVERFGEDAENDRLIRKYGYCGRENILRLVKENADLRENLSVAAHLIHGSSDGRFNITYCPGKMTEEEVRSVGFDYMSYEEAEKLYPHDKLTDGHNIIIHDDDSAEIILYISNPALGLWEA